MHRPTTLTRIPAVLTLLLVVAAAPLPAQVADPLPTETLFVIDLSASMAGPSIQQAREALLARLGRLRPEDRFNILGFNDGQMLFRREFQPADLGTLDAARAWLQRLRATGGTMTYQALMRGLALMDQSRSAHPQRVVFLSDGAMANEQELLWALGERLGEVRLHTIGIGHAPNAEFMRKMARLGRGLCTFASGTAEAENRGASLLARVERPAAAGLRHGVATGPVRVAAGLPAGGTDRPLRLLLGSILAAVGLATLSLLGLRECG